MRKRLLLIAVSMLLSATARSQSIFGDPDAKPGTQPSVQPPRASSAPTAGTAETQPVPPSLAPVPDSAAQKAASESLHEVLGEEIAAAKTPDQMKALAHKLLNVANDESGVRQYLLLIKARDLSIRAGDLEDCDAALTALATVFAVDLPKLRLEAYSKLAATVSQGDRAAFCGAASLAVLSTLAADELDVARATAELGLQTAHKTNDPELVKQATADVDAVRMRTTAYTGIKLSLATLSQQPDDADANLKVGKYRCFFKGDWQSGLPLLAKGSDAKLKALAAKELAGVTSADDQMTLADGWREFGQAQVGLAKQNIAAHAGTWYEQAAPGLSGLKKVAAEKQLEEIQRLASGPAAPPESLLVEALIDGDSELHITPTGIYWVEKGVAKPGMHSGAHLPTYVNGKEWWPKWGKPTEEKGDDKSQPLSLPIGLGDLNYEVVAITEKRGEKGIADRDAVTLQKSTNEYVLSIPDSQTGAMWYAVRLSKNKMTVLKRQLVGKWYQPSNDISYTLDVDGAATQRGNTGTWGANADGTAIALKWKGYGWVDVYKLSSGKWLKFSYQNGILKSTDAITPP